MPTFKCNIEVTLVGNIYIDANSEAECQLIIDNAPVEEVTKVISTIGAIEQRLDTTIHNITEQIVGVDFNE